MKYHTRIQGAPDAGRAADPTRRAPRFSPCLMYMDRRFSAYRLRLTQGGAGVSAPDVLRRQYACWRYSARTPAGRPWWPRSIQLISDRVWCLPGIVQAAAGKHG